MFKVKKESTEKIYTVFAVQKDKFGGTEFLIMMRHGAGYGDLR